MKLPCEQTYGNAWRTAMVGGTVKELVNRSKGLYLILFDAVGDWSAAESVISFRHLKRFSAGSRSASRDEVGAGTRREPRRRLAHKRSASSAAAASTHSSDTPTTNLIPDAPSASALGKPSHSPSDDSAAASFVAVASSAASSKKSCASSVGSNKAVGSKRAGCPPHGKLVDVTPASKSKAESANKDSCEPRASTAEAVAMLRAANGHGYRRLQSCGSSRFGASLAAPPPLRAAAVAAAAAMSRGSASAPAAACRSAVGVPPTRKSQANSRSSASAASLAASRRVSRTGRLGGKPRTLMHRSSGSVRRSVARGRLLPKAVACSSGADGDSGVFPVQPDTPSALSPLLPEPAPAVLQAQALLDAEGALTSESVRCGLTLLEPSVNHLSPDASLFECLWSVFSAVGRTTLDNSWAEALNHVDGDVP